VSPQKRTRAQAKGQSKGKKKKTWPQVDAKQGLIHLETERAKKLKKNTVGEEGTEQHGGSRKQKKGPGQKREVRIDPNRNL